MKKLMIVFASSCILFACNSSSNNGQDSVDSAQDVNDSVADAGKNNANNPALNDKTTDFATEAADGGMMEVQLGKLAQQKAQSKSVKDFGTMMVDDHTKANDELKALAGKKNVTLPAKIGDAHQKKYDDLSKKSGKDFDKAYINAMVDGHEAAVSDFKKQTDNSDADVKEWVNKTLPALQMHLDSAKAIKKALKY